MAMPGRNGKTVTGGGWAQGTTKVNGVSISETLTIDSRTYNTPTEYKAATSIEFTDGFISSSTDEFVAQIVDAGNTNTTTGSGTGNGSSAVSGYRYGFNGKELDGDIANDDYDYGARIYDGRIGRWLSMDGLANKYPDVSPYIYALNTPLQGKDPDGNVVIFINGQHTGQGGQAVYWGGYDKRAMDKIGDHSSRYVDGALGGFSNTLAPTPGNISNPFPLLDYFIKKLTSSNLNKKVRINAGEAQGMRDAESIISNLSEGETIKIVAHSMGNAFSRGYVNGIIKYAKEHNLQNKIKGKFQYELDVSPFQGKGLPANPIVQTTETQVGGLDGGSIEGIKKKGIDGSVPTVAPIPGVKNISSKSDADKGHAISELSTINIQNRGNAGTETKKPIEQGVNNSKIP